MKILIITSKVFYDKIKDIACELETLGHEISYPNCIENSNAEQNAIDSNSFIEFKQTMYKQSAKKIKEIDAVLVLNYDKNNQPNYIGGATFIEIYEAWTADKQIYILNPISDSIIKSEIQGFDPVILNGDYTMIK